MSRAYRITVKESETRELRGEDEICTRLELLEVLPPASQYGGAFLVGEPYDHHAGPGRPRCSCFKREAGKFYVLSGPVTVAAFRKMFGGGQNDYVE